MKKILFFAVILILVACNQNKRKTTDNNLPTENPPSTDSLVWVGVFAEWKKTPGEIIDGGYDTSHQIFVPCATNNAQQVAREKINLLSTGDCHEDAPHHIKLMMMIKTNGKDSIRVIGESLINVDTVNNEIIGVFHEGTKIRRIKMQENVVRDLRRRQVKGLPVKRLP
jgi:hypothetical protein